MGEIGETASDVTLVQNVIDNVAEVRKDCVVFFSPASQDVVITTGSSTQTTNVTTFKNAVNRNTSYAFMDSGWKRTYDRYNDCLLYTSAAADE